MLHNKPYHFQAGRDKNNFAAFRGWQMGMLQPIRYLLK
jgi:hypothetical protein